MSIVLNLFIFAYLFFVNGSEVISSNQYLYKQSTDAIFKAHINEGFLLEKLTKMGSKNIEIKSTQTSDTTWQVYVSREIKNSPPKLLQPFVNEWQSISYEQFWVGKKGGPYTGEYQLNLEQAGIEIDGTILIKSENSNTLLKNDVRYFCTIPMFGKSIANYAAKTGEVSIDEDFKYMEQHVIDE